ncbi:hypothetical protein IMCC12053_2140 [Celeribacter marinus]|uniref:Uncharacterized protein n=1 Tax=Celeribacter marinus TaxID=1397108 RepID=A0A0P0AB66_9RHOB|nr:hypothetical protein IMCC12053_2140 [Celeribacter marinus]
MAQIAVFAPVLCRTNDAQSLVNLHCAPCELIASADKQKNPQKGLFIGANRL